MNSAQRVENLRQSGMKSQVESQKSIQFLVANVRTLGILSNFKISNYICHRHIFGSNSDNFLKLMFQQLFSITKLGKKQTSYPR